MCLISTRAPTSNAYSFGVLQTHGSSNVRQFDFMFAKIYRRHWSGIIISICCEARLLTTDLHRTHSFEMETATHWIYCDSHYFIKRRCDDRRWRCIECENCKWFWHFLTELNKWPGRTFICAMRWLPAPQWPHHWWSIARNCEINVNRNCSIKFQFRDSIAYSMPLYGDHCYLFTFVSSTRFQCKEV